MKTNSIINKTILAVLVVALALASFPLTSAYAAGMYDPTNPPQQNGQISNERLENIWARQQQAYERLGRFFDQNGGLLDKVQKLIDRAKSNGKDVSAVQVALDAFEAAVKEARPAYEGLKGTINSHQGFDANGKVIDAEKAKAIVKEMGTTLKEIRAQIGDAAKALRDAIKAFREANKPAVTPTSDAHG